MPINHLCKLLESCSLEERELSKEEAASKGRKGREKTAKEIFLSETQKSSTTKLQDTFTKQGMVS